MYSFGSGGGGRLGHVNDTSNQLTPKKIEELPKVTAIAAGTSHSLILTESGDVYSFGAGSDGQLGHGNDTSNQLTPKKIEELPKVTAIAVGGVHSLILTESGEVYSFGAGSIGQLGHGDTSNQLSPQKIEGSSNGKAIAVGSSHSLVLVESYNSGISPNMETFDKNEQKQENITINMKLNGNT